MMLPASVVRIRAIAVKELRQMSRDRMTLAMIVGIPLLQMMIFGYGINYDVRHVRAGVVDQPPQFLDASGPCNELHHLAGGDLGHQ